jgi:hypothetical protein
MNKLMILTLFAGVFCFALPGHAGDVHVKGYYRKDGTYVRPHIRSAPDHSLSNNYGPSTTDSQLMNPRSRDYDGDGAPNYLDYDDDNDGAGDEWDSHQYGSGDYR